MSSSMDMLDVGQAQEFKLASRRNGFTNEDLKWLCEGDTLSLLRQVRLGQAAIDVVTHVIDCDALPSMRIVNSTIQEHRRYGKFPFNSKTVKLYFPQDPSDGATLSAGTALMLLESVRVRPLNGNVLDFLIENKHLIPVAWQQYRTVHFWGTIYKNSEGKAYIRSLLYLPSFDRWDERVLWLSNECRATDAAAVCAN